MTLVNNEIADLIRMLSLHVLGVVAMAWDLKKIHGPVCDWNFRTQWDLCSMLGCKPSYSDNLDFVFSSPKFLYRVSVKNCALGGVCLYARDG